MKWLLKGGKVLDPASGKTEAADILIEGNRIAAIGTNLTDKSGDAGVEDISGKIVTAGFIDMHVHFREPGREDKETLRSGGRAAARGGYVAVACMPNTHPPIDSVAAVGYIKHEGQKVSPSRIYPIACITKRQEGQEITEMASLFEAGAIAFSDDGKCVMNADLMRRAFEYARMLDAVLIGHEEDHNMTGGGHAHEGYQSTILGIPGMPAAAEEIIVARDIILARDTQSRIHIAHISSARSVQLVREAKAQGIRVTAEVTPHHLLLTDETLVQYDSNYKMNPPLRTEADRQALLAGLRDGTIDAIATDHAPHTREEKEVEFGCAAFGVIGLETAVPVLLDRLVAGRELDLGTLVKALSLGPSAILGLDLGTMKVGAPACLTVLDTEASETIELTQFESKARNSPFAGWTVKGLPVMTVVDGKVVMKNRVVVDDWQPRALAHAAR